MMSATAAHWNACCNVCQKTNFQYCRYKCLQCYSYNLCSECHDNKLIKCTHNPSHPFQCVLDRTALELFFAGDEIPDLFADSFTCPYCGLMGHAPKELVQHVRSMHRHDLRQVICPLCVAIPTMRTTLMPRLSLHMAILHANGSMVPPDMEGNIDAVRRSRHTPPAVPAPAPPVVPPPPSTTPQLPSSTLSDLFGDSLGSTISHDDDFDPEDFNFEGNSVSFPDLGADAQRLRRVDALSNLAASQLSEINEFDAAE